MKISRVVQLICLACTFFISTLSAGNAVSYTTYTYHGSPFTVTVTCTYDLTECGGSSTRTTTATLSLAPFDLPSGSTGTFNPTTNLIVISSPDPHLCCGIYAPGSSVTLSSGIITAWDFFGEDYGCCAGTTLSVSSSGDRLFEFTEISYTCDSYISSCVTWEGSGAPGTWTTSPTPLPAAFPLFASGTRRVRSAQLAQKAKTSPSTAIVTQPKRELINAGLIRQPRPAYHWPPE